MPESFKVVCIPCKAHHNPIRHQGAGRRHTKTLSAAHIYILVKGSQPWRLLMSTLRDRIIITFRNSSQRTLSHTRRVSK